jgi:uncharacterized YigZ family protein
MSNLERTSIKVLNSISEFKLKEKGSTFIGQAFTVWDEETALARLNEIRKKHYDATHNCYAYRIYTNKFKYSDDGEPNGTAGIRIYNAIEHFDLQNILVIVTRYYGGVKLGVGPLGKAYYQAAFEVLKESEVSEKIYYQKVKISYDYNFVKTIHKVLTDFEGTILNNSFDTGPYSECLVYPEIVENLAETLKNLSSGKIKIEKTDFFQFK